MSNELLVLKTRISNSPVLKNILGAETEQYALRVIAEIAKTQGTDKDLTQCTADSITNAIIKACDLKLSIDSRQHCHLVKYGNKAELQIGYRGFVYSIKRHYQDANIDVALVYEGDDFKLVKEGDTTTYSLTKNNPFANKDKIIGGFCYISYTLNGRLVSFCETMSIEEIKKIKGCAKSSAIWDKWFEEKAKVALIKRACKIHFSGITEIEQITEYDNQEFDLEKQNEIVVTDSLEQITTDQAFAIEGLCKEKNKDIKEICEVYGIDAIIQLPANQFDEVFKNLNEV